MRNKKLTPFQSFLFGILNGLFLLFLWCFWIGMKPAFEAEFKYRWEKFFLRFCSCPSSEKWVDAPNLYFSLAIPKIKAEAKIIPNVDAGNFGEYSQVLQEGVAHAKGTAFPGMGQPIFLFAHSTNAPWNISRYNAIFYLLHELNVGDEIVIFFYGKRYIYRVFEKKIVARNETDFWQKKEGEVLILQTCWPPGTTQKALLVFGKRKYE